MSTLNRHVLKSILGYLDKAMEQTRDDDKKLGLESNATWYIRMAKERLLEAGLTDLDVQALTVGEIDDTSAKQQDM